MCITPSVHWDDLRGSWTILLIVVAFCLLVFGLAGWLVHCAQADTRKREEFLSSLSAANPAQDAQQAFRSGDARLLMLPLFQTPASGDYAGVLNVPGVGEMRAEKAARMNCRMVPGISGLNLGNRQDIEYRQAEAYALEYNRAILAQRGRR